MALPASPGQISLVDILEEKGITYSTGNTTVISLRGLSSDIYSDYYDVPSTTFQNVTGTPNGTAPYAVSEFHGWSSTPSIGTTVNVRLNGSPLTTNNQNSAYTQESGNTTGAVPNTQYIKHRLRRTSTQIIYEIRAGAFGYDSAFKYSPTGVSSTFGTAYTTLATFDLSATSVKAVLGSVTESATGNATAVSGYYNTSFDSDFTYTATSDTWQALSVNQSMGWETWSTAAAYCFETNIGIQYFPITIWARLSNYLDTSIGTFNFKQYCAATDTACF